MLVGVLRLMALLSNCWLIIEYFIIPDGYVKWFYLSFYIHPFFLFFCQIFLWFRWLPYILVLLPFSITCYLCSHVVVFLSCFMEIIRSFARFRDSEVADDVPEYENIPELIPELITRNQHQIVDSYSIAQSVVRIIHYEVSEPGSSKIGFSEVDDEASEELENVDINEDLVELENVDINEDSCSDEEDDFSSSDQFTSSESPVSSAGDVEMDLHFPVPLDSTPNFAIMEQELIVQRDQGEEEVDPFYKSYEERMRWFDLLNHDRAFASSIIQSKQSANNISSIQGAEAGFIYVPESSISWGRMVKNRMLKNLENDLEMVYVAQSCLTWEALCYQHLKVKAMTAECSSTSTSPLLGVGAAFYYNSSVAGNFQKFKILLERFMEDERLAEGKRYQNYVQKRSSLKSILQVPDISGSHMEEETGRMEEAVRATDMLKAIEKSIKAFWLFLQAEKKKPSAWWKASSLLWTHSSPLEDPRDLKLFHDLTKTLQKKELRLKDLKGKKRCWLRRTVDPLGENIDQKKEILFATIEMKLVSRVLSMSMISTSQLKWCQEKLNNIDFKEGKIIRSCITGPLFPFS